MKSSTLFISSAFEENNYKKRGNSVEDYEGNKSLIN